MPSALYFLRRINLALGKSKSRQYFLFIFDPLARLFAWPSTPRGRAMRWGAVLGDSRGRAVIRYGGCRPPRRLNPWRPSPPFRGRAMCYGSLFRDLSEEPPSPGSSPGPLPQGGVRYFATEVADPLASKLALSPFQGACNVLREFIRRVSERTPPSPANAGPLPLSGGVRCATRLCSGIQGACGNTLRRLPTPSPPQSLVALSPKGACGRLGYCVQNLGACDALGTCARGFKGRALFRYGTFPITYLFLLL